MSLHAETLTLGILKVLQRSHSLIIRCKAWNILEEMGQGGGQVGPGEVMSLADC